MKRSLFITVLSLIAIVGLRAQDATPVHAEWPIADVATATDGTNNGFPLAQMTMSSIGAMDTKSDISFNDASITMVRFHHTEAGAKSAWPAETAENVDRYIDFALKAPSDKDIHVTNISITVAGYSTATMKCNLKAGWGDDFSNSRIIGDVENHQLTHAAAEQLNLSVNLNIPAGQTMHIRLLPWHDQAKSGKYICVKDVEIDGEAVAAGTPVEPEVYTVTFLDWDGTEIDSQEVEEGQAATAPADPIRDGYTFTGWDKDFSQVYSDLVVTAQYSQNAIFRGVTFLDWDGTEIDFSTVEFGCAVDEPAHPSREGFLFTGWSGGFGPVYQNTTVTAQYVALNDADEDIEVVWPLTEHHGGSSNGYAEPFAQTKEGIDYKFFCQPLSAQFPDGSGFDSDHPVQMMSAPGEAWLPNATTYNPEVFVEFAFKAAENMKVNDVHLYAGSYGLDNMRFSVLYATNDDFENPTLLEHTDAQQTYVMAAIDWSLNATVTKGQIFRLRVYPWLDNAGSAYMNRQWYFLLSDVKINAILGQDEPPVEPDPQEALDNTEAVKTAVKFFENGQLMIEKNSVIYNAQGVVVK